MDVPSPFLSSLFIYIGLIPAQYRHMGFSYIDFQKRTCSQNKKYRKSESLLNSFEIIPSAVSLKKICPGVLA